MSELPSDLAGFEAAARECAETFAWEYLARGSGDGVTLRANLAAWQRWRLLPHVLRDVSTVDTRTTVLGTAIRAPILVAPTAMHRLFCDDGELATARGAANVSAAYIVSMAATTSLEDVAAAAPTGLHWAQMYMLRDRGRTRALCERAREAGFKAVVASVDGAAVGRGGTRGGAGSLSPPGWVRYPNLASPDDPETADIMALVGDFDPSVTFDDLELFREWSGLPVVVKGLLRADDADRVAALGVSGIAVSNHGGRIFDGVAATADVLPSVVAAVGDRAEIYVDGGVRSGTDVAKAVALGARAVLVGRPVLWGLTVGAAEGVEWVLERLRTELEAAMAFCGAPDLTRLTRDLVSA